MDATSQSLAFRARWVFPVVEPPIEGGVVVLHDGRIASLDRSEAANVVDLGNVAIIPGLVNAHTHLEFSSIKQPLGHAGISLPEWIRQVIRHRREQPSEGTNAVPAGLAEVLHSGTTRLGEISTSWCDEWQLPDNVTIFREVICLDRARYEEVILRAEQPLANIPLHCRALSPHAPYTVHPDLFTRLVERARLHAWSLAMHLAESREELQLLQTGDGPFRELLEQLGVWREDANPQGRRPLTYLEQLRSAARSLVIHGNYLDTEEIRFLGEYSDRMAVVYCPRTHDFFKHEAYPLRSMLESGVNVCLGTDSRASNPDLSLLAEMKFAAARHAVSPQILLQMATLNGARMFCRDAGAIALNMRADLAVIELPDRTGTDPYELLFDDNSRVVATYLAGNQMAANQ